MSAALQQASVIRSRRAILDRAELVCRPGRLSTFVGPNGAGKSTALKLLTGSLKPDQGSVTLDGEALPSIAPLALAKRRAFVAQTPLLSFPFQVHEVVAMGRTPYHGTTRASDDEAVIDEVMDLLDIEGLAERNYLTLSGGERQRVNIARALAQLWDHETTHTPWLFLDEPTSALDLKYQLRLMQLLRQLVKRDWGIVVVLHDLQLVQEYAHDVVLFQNGRLLGAGPVDQWLTPVTVQQVFELEKPYALGAGSSSGAS